MSSIHLPTQHLKPIPFQISQTGLSCLKDDQWRLRWFLSNQSEASLRTGPPAWRHNFNKDNNRPACSQGHLEGCLRFLLPIVVLYPTRKDSLQSFKDSDNGLLLSFNSQNIKAKSDWTNPLSCLLWQHQIKKLCSPERYLIRSFECQC